MRNSCDVIVIGAGIVGAAAARALATAGLKPLLLSRGRGIGEATPAAAGMLAPQIEAEPGDQLLDLALAARERHAALAVELADAGFDVGWAGDGIVRVALERAEAGRLQARVTSQRSRGLAAEWWDAAELARRVPGLAPEAVGALFAPHDGHLDNVALADALIRDGVRQGVMLEFTAARALLLDGARVAGVRTAAGVRRAPRVVLAAGAWSPALTGLPRPVPIEPVRGQMLRTAWPAGVPERVLFGPAGYLVPRRGDAIVGSTMEHAGFDARTTAAGLAQVRDAAAALVPGFADLPASGAWAGLRPLTPDGRPIIGPDPDVHGLVYAAGHGRNGILLGPLTGDLVAELLVRGETSRDLAPYSIMRFGAA